MTPDNNEKNLIPEEEKKILKIIHGDFTFE